MSLTPVDIHNKALQRTKRNSQFYGYAEDRDVIGRFLAMRYPKKTTQRVYGFHLRSFAEFSGGSDEMLPSQVREVSSVHIDAFLQSMENDGRAAGTIRLARSVLVKFFKQMVAVEIIERNPADPEIIRAAPRVSQSATIKHLSRDQANKTVSSATLTTGVTGTRDRVIILMLVGCALRRSELAAVDIEHIRKNGESWELYIPRGKTGDRTVPVLPHIMESIMQLCAEDGIETGALFRSYSRRPAYTGKRITARTVHDIVSRVSGLAGHKVGPHALRHTACTLALESGATLVQAQKFLGHSDPKTTIIYEHIVNDADNSAAAFVNVTG